MTTGNPTGLTVGDNVTIADVGTGSSSPFTVSTSGYNGTFAVTGIPDGTHFTYTALVSGLTAGTGGNAASNTMECGLEDHQAAALPNGEVLVAGGDNFTFLAAASKQAFLFTPSSATWAATGSLNTPRELYQLTTLDPTVVNGPLAGQVLATGGVNGQSAGCSPVGDILATSANTAELYNPTSGTWTPTSNNMTTLRAGHGTVLWKTGPFMGKLMIVGGIDIEAGTFPSTCVALTSLKQTTTKNVDIFDPGTGAEGTFSATTSMNQSRGGMGAGFIGVGTNNGDFIVMGGECANGHLSSWVVGTAAAGSAGTCGTAAKADYSELFDPNTLVWTTPGPGFYVGPTSAVSTTSESGFTVTVSMSTANPTGLILGDSVTVAGNSVSGYNGTFVVTGIPDATHFTYTALSSGFTAGAGGTAAATTAPVNGPASADLP